MNYDPNHYCVVSNVCSSCGSAGTYVTIETGERVCENCGIIDSHYREFDDGAPYYKPDPYAKTWGPFVVSEEPQSTKGRYKERFHFNERMAQWRLWDPVIPQKAFQKLYEEAGDAKYGPHTDFTRATVILLTRRTGLRKYRERWKQILYVFSGRSDTPPPDESLVQWCSRTFDLLVHNFDKHRTSMPNSVTASGRKERHNFISYNYVQRKLLEAKEVFTYHNDFPIPRSHTKLHTLDDVFAGMAEEIGLPFTRTCVIKRPKLKKRRCI